MKRRGGRENLGREGEAEGRKKGVMEGDGYPFFESWLCSCLVLTYHLQLGLEVQCIIMWPIVVTRATRKSRGILGY